MKPLVPLDPDFLKLLNEVILDQTQAYLQRKSQKKLAKKPTIPRKIAKSC